jgi:hypothetical protein
MPFIKLQFRPGINRDNTNYTNEGGWFDCDKIRFRSGFPEKIGGWIKATSESYDGVARQLLNWITSYSDNLLAVGTHKKVYIEAGGNFYDITPLRVTFSSTDTDNCFATTNTSTTVTVNITGHGANDGDYVTFSGATAVGGVPADELNAEYVVQYVDADSFNITVTTAATSTVAAGGGTSITAAFQVEVGNPDTTLGYGWGTGVWGGDESSPIPDRAWGLGSSSPVDLPQRDWFFDNFDNDLVVNIRSGKPYYWARGTTIAPDTALGTRAVSLQTVATDAGYDANDVPVKVGQLLVSQNDKHLLAFGAVPYGSTSSGDYDPLLIRWASQDEPGQWEPQVTNSAGFIRVSRGSKIVRALPTRQEILVWTDTHLYALQFLGTIDVFGLQEYADGVSIASPRACASAANTTFWMGRDKFYVYTGRVDTLPCSVRNYVFSDIDFTQADQIVCGTNEEWSEVWWFYPSESSGNNWNDRYVIYNYLDRIWYFGSIERTAWLDAPNREYPIAAGSGRDDAGGYLYDHENGIEDDTGPMTSFIESSDFDLGDGDAFAMTRRIIPDLKFTGSTSVTPEIDMEVKTRSFPGGVLSSDSADRQRVIRSAVGTYTDQVFIRARARHMALRVESDTAGVQWQLGSPRLDARPDGKR